MPSRALFPTRLYEADLWANADGGSFSEELEAAVLMLQSEDRAGRAWCRSNGYAGYTSYASLDDLPRRASVFADLKRRLDRHVTIFAQELGFELGARRLRLDSLWVNVLRPRASHTGHIHPQSVVSGTAYVRTPTGASAIRFEDPRLPLMMAAPPLRSDAPAETRRFFAVMPTAGTVLLWESWLRHEVTLNRSREDRISVSFNYAWG